MCLSFLDEIQSFLDEIQKVASLGTFIQKGKWWKNRTDSAVTEAK